MLARIRRGANVSAADLQSLHQQRKTLIDRVRKRLVGFDAYVCPTVPIVAPTINSVADDDAYTATNQLVLRNPTVVNLIDGCAISIPMSRPEAPPTGLMIAGMTHSDRHILRAASWIEERL